MTTAPQIFTPTKAERDRIAREIEAFLPIIAPDDFRCPVYVVWMEDVPAAPELSSVRFSGLAGPTLDRQAQDIIGERWRGRGIALYLKAAGLSSGGGRERFELNAAAVGLHEAAHAVAGGYANLLDEGAAPAVALGEYLNVYKAEPLEQYVQRFRRSVVAGLKRGRSVKDVAIEHEADERQWAVHDSEFIRALIHLRHRAVVFGFCPPTVSLAMTARLDHYSLSPITKYAEALGDEPARLIDKPIRRGVLMTMPPPAFLNLWHSDYERRLQGIED